MNDILQPFLRKFTTIFFDDILIYNESLSAHLTFGIGAQNLITRQVLSGTLQVLVCPMTIGVPRSCYFWQRH